MEGIILEAESGDYLGKHRGFWFYTIGQRQGLRLPGGPWYVPIFWCILNICVLPCHRLIMLQSHVQWKSLFCPTVCCCSGAKFFPHHINMYALFVLKLIWLKAFHISCRYVVEKDVQNNVVFVSRNYYSLDKRRRTFRVGSLNWFDSSGPGNDEQLKCKVTGYYIQ